MAAHESQAVDDSALIGQAQGAEAHSGDFSWALDRLKRGFRVYRAGWNGKGMWIALQDPDAHSKMSLPYIFLHTAQAQRVPWLASQTDMLAEDWETF